MNDMWGSARACRPSIFAKPQKPALGRGTPNSSFQDFSKFFADFVEKAKPPRNFTASELYKNLSLAYTSAYQEPCSNPGQFYIFFRTENSEESIPFIDLTAALLVMRNCYLEYHSDESAATSSVLSYANRMGREARLWSSPENRSWRIDRAALNLYCDLTMKRPAVPLPHTWEIENRLWAMSHMIRNEWFSESPNRAALHPLKSLNGTAPGRAALESFANQSRSHFEPSFLSYRNFFCRLCGIFGQELPGKAIALRRPDVTEKVFASAQVAVIGLYPWEADHILKARHMAMRGIPVAQPVGRMFVDETEFALFEWVKGKQLYNLRSAEAWEAFGRVVRLCHEAGVKPDDAAGRNAIWNGAAVKLIDFEHTALNKKAEPLDADERKTSLSRVEGELHGTGRLFDAFMRGYNSPIRT